MLDLLNYNRPQLEDFFEQAWQMPRFRARQLVQWVHGHQQHDFTQMLNLSQTLRAKLQASAQIKLPSIQSDKTAQDGTRKWLFGLDDGNWIETVYIPEAKRATLCISSQVGCALDCSFCATGKQGFNRNLTTAEIIGQLALAKQLLAQTRTAEPDRHLPEISNVVMMGMGEPLLNFDNVTAALDLMMDDLAYGLSKYRVTVSTSGVIPAMQRLKAESPAALAVSLHATSNPLRDHLVPLNKKYPLEALLPVCQDYFADHPKRSVTYEYVMLDGLNDRPEDIKALKQRLQQHRCKINLIPFNPFPGSPYRCTAMPKIEDFKAQLQAAGFNTTIRKTRGQDIDAACGQLAGKVFDKTKRTAAGRARRESR